MVRRASSSLHRRHRHMSESLLLVFMLQLLLLLLRHPSHGQRVEVGDGRGHTFAYEVDSDVSITPGHTLPGLRKAAKRWCKRQSKELAVGLDTCVEFLVQDATQKVIQARAAAGKTGGKTVSGETPGSWMDPAKGLAPGLFAYQAAQEVPSQFHSGENTIKREPFTVETVRLAWSPSLVYLPGFMNEETCEELIRLASPRMQSSEAKDAAAGVHRNSSTAIFEREDELANPFLTSLTTRVHNLMNVPPDHGEGLQVAHYSPGQSYGFHADAFEGAPRAYTFLGFLNTPEGGGAAIFPLVSADGRRSTVDPAIFDGHRKADPDLLSSFCEGPAGDDIMRINPKQGDAILFTPMRPWMETDHRALHAACHVTQGEKWVVQRWARPIYDPSYARAWAATND